MDSEGAAFPDGLKPFDLLPAAANVDTTRLVWDFGGDSGNEKGHVKIYLKPLTDDESATNRDEKGAKDEEQAESKAQSTGSNGEVDNTPKSTTTNDEETIEASVLQYQRQQRKIQAAKRAGAELTEDQLEIVFEDDLLVVVNKPAGVLTVPGIHNNDSIANLLFQRLQQQQDDKKDSILCPDAPSMTVHRLDMDTSGLVCFGKTKSIVSTLHQVFRRETDDNNNNNNKKKRNKNRKRKNHPKTGEQAREDGVSTQSGSIEDDPQTDNALPHTVVKEYEALVCGHLPLAIDSGHIDLPLQRDVHHPPFMRVSTPHSESLARQVVDALRARNWTKLSKRNPKPSQTLFRVVAREYYKDKTTASNDGTDQSKIPVTRLAMTPITGRTHQLRVHCAAMGFPIVGDPVYGLYGESAFCGGLFHNPVELLHATKDNNQEEQGWRAPISLQKQIMEVHPPGVKDMCLHAKKLGFPHPVTKDMRDWEVAPKF